MKKLIVAICLFASVAALPVVAAAGTGIPAGVTAVKAVDQSLVPGSVQVMFFCMNPGATDYKWYAGKKAGAVVYGVTYKMNGQSLRLYCDANGNAINL